MRARWLLSSCLVVVAGCSSTSASSNVTSPAATAPKVTVSDHDANEIAGIVQLTMGLKLGRIEVDCVGGPMPTALRDALVTQGTGGITAAQAAQLYQQVARCASLDTQAQFGTNLIKTQGLSAREAACVTKGFFDVLRKDLAAAASITRPIANASPAVRAEVSAAISSCLSKGKLDKFLGIST